MKTILLALLSVAACGCSRPVDESQAIKHVLEQESASWRAGNVQAHAACWHIQPYSRILVSTPEGKCFDVPPATMLIAAAGMGRGGTSVNTRYHIQVADDRAWVSHDEVSTAPDGHRTYSHEIRLLEKIEHEWKLVAQSIHLYKP
jgi:hypothetical protein